MSTSQLNRIEARLSKLEHDRSIKKNVERFAIWRDDCAGFQREVLGRELWSKQIEVCDAIVKSPITVVPAGRSVGKSFMLSGVILWWLYTRPGSRVVSTGPDFRQCVSVLWSELKRAISTSKEPLPYQRLSKGYGSPQRLEIDATQRWEALGWAAGAEEGMSGQHAGQLLVIVDEASGIAPPIWRGIDGLGATRLVVCGNPISVEGRFRELHELATDGSPNITTVPISSLDSPHADMDHSPVGLMSRVTLQSLREIYGGENSPWWHSNIKGLFPGQESVQFYVTAHVDACVNPAILADPHWLDHAPGVRRMACDVGGGVGADPSVICVRDDKQLLELWQSEWHGVLDEARFRLEPEIIERARRWGIPGDRVTYDQSGLGRSLGSYLAAQGLPNTIGFYGAGRGGPRFINRRSACAHALRDRLDPARKGFCPFYCGDIPLWPELRKELLIIRDAPMEIQEGFVKQRIEERESVAARLHHSANLADALTQSFNYRGD